MEREIRSFNGTGNNLANPNWGATHSPLRREGPAAYSDGVSAMAGPDRPNPRLISNQLCFSLTDTISPNGLSNFVWAWGQFLDHELDITPSGKTEREPIDVPANDVDPEVRDALSTSERAQIPFSRSTFVQGTGDSSRNPREQINRASSYIDASNVYGSTLYRAQNLRSFEDGKLISQMIDGEEFPPFNPPGPNRLENDDEHVGDSEAFVAGDVRINEHSVLTAMHTLFLREHNRLCDVIKSEDPTLADEEIFQLARCRVIAQMQVITFNEFLPVLVGANRIPAYRGYDAYLNPTISNVFSTACYRLGHSMLPESIPLVAANGTVDRLSLRELFFRPQLFTSGFQGRVVLGTPGYVLKIDDIFRGLMQSNMLRIDPHITESVRSFLFHQTEREISESLVEFLDLAALNIQRGRDHGLPDYNQCRREFGLQRITRFAEITNDTEVQSKLRNLYESVDDIDLWVGALCEDPLPGASVGELIAAVLIDQFGRLRDGDRFWYENDPLLTPQDIAEIRSTRLSDIIRRNTGLDVVTGRVLKAHLALNNNRDDEGREQPLDIAIYENRLLFSHFETPGNINTDRPGGTEQLFVTAHKRNEKITVSDGNNFIHGLFNLSVDKYTLYQCQQKLRSNEPKDQNLFPAEGTIAVFEGGRRRRLLAAGRDRVGTPQGWIFNASTDQLPDDPVNDQADIFKDKTFTVANKLQFSDFNTPGIPVTDPEDEKLVCSRIDDQYLTIDDRHGRLRLIAVFTLNLEGKFEVYTILEETPPGFDLGDKQHFRAQGTAVLFKAGRKIRLRVAGHDEDFSGRGWIFDAKET